MKSHADLSTLLAKEKSHGRQHVCGNIIDIVNIVERGSSGER